MRGYNVDELHDEEWTDAFSFEHVKADPRSESLCPQLLFSHRWIQPHRRLDIRLIICTSAQKEAVQATGKIEEKGVKVETNEKGSRGSGGIDSASGECDLENDRRFSITETTSDCYKHACRAWCSEWTPHFASIRACAALGSFEDESTAHSILSELLIGIDVGNGEDRFFSERCIVDGNMSTSLFEWEEGINYPDERFCNAVGMLAVRQGHFTG